MLSEVSVFPDLALDVAVGHIRKSSALLLVAERYLPLPLQFGTPLLVVSSLQPTCHSPAKSSLLLSSTANS